MTDVPMQVAKTIVKFTDTIHTQQQILDHFINTLFPLVKAEVAAFVAQGNITNEVVHFRPDNQLEVEIIDTNRWQIYPKYAVTFTTPQILVDALVSFSGRMLTIKGIIKDDLILFGATNLLFHMHYPDDRPPVPDEF